MKARLEPKRVKGKTSCRPIQEELNDNPYTRVNLTILCKQTLGKIPNWIPD